MCVSCTISVLRVKLNTLALYIRRAEFTETTTPVLPTERRLRMRSLRWQSYRQTGACVYAGSLTDRQALAYALAVLPTDRRLRMRWPGREPDMVPDLSLSDWTPLCSTFWSSSWSASFLMLALPRRRTGFSSTVSALVSFCLNLSV